MSNILFLCPTHRDHREIDALGLARRHNFFFHDYASLALEDLVADEPPVKVELADPCEEIRRLVEYSASVQFDGIVSTDDYPGSSLASIMARALGLPGVAPAVNLRCQHKHYARIDQRKFAPEAVPNFRLLSEEQLPHLEALRYPMFVKPVKSFFSVGAYRIESAADLPSIGAKAVLGKTFFRPFEMLLREYADLELGPPVIVEDLLQGVQVTLEGYAQGGRVHVIGVVDSIMYPGTRSFQRFEYPSALPLEAQQRMTDIATKVMTGIGFDSGLFNIEFMVNPETQSIHIIEINPRMASQFADLYEKVDGTNTYEVLLDLALGKAPNVRRRQGLHAFAASCVLRSFENAIVTALPAAEEIERVQQRCPDARIEVLATEGRRLSQEMQDGQSYRYGIVSLGGRDRRDVMAALEYCRAHLTFTFDKSHEAQTWTPAKRAARGGRH